MTRYLAVLLILCGPLIFSGCTARRKHNRHCQSQARKGGSIASSPGTRIGHISNCPMRHRSGATSKNFRSILRRQSFSTKRYSD